MGKVIFDISPVHRRRGRGHGQRHGEDVTPQFMARGRVAVTVVP